jgi:hemerythrin-like metal-binding protein
MITWKPSMSVQIVEIDEQHKKFIEIMREMETAVEAKLDRSVTSAILIKLFGYGHYHFATEEKYFAQFHYKEGAEHRDIHERFFEQVRSYRKRHELGEDVALEAAQFMFDWLVGHIEKVDKRYVQCFHEHGLR